MLKVEKRTYGRMESLNQTPGFIARRGVWSGRRPGRASGKKRAYRPNGALSPDDRSRREKGGLEHEGWPSPVKWSTPDLIARRGVWSGRRPGRARGKKRAYRPNGELSPDPRSRREKGVWNMRERPSYGVVKPDPGSYREKGGLEREKAGTSECKRGLESRPPISAREGGSGT